MLGTILLASVLAPGTPSSEVSVTSAPGVADHEVRIEPLQLLSVGAEMELRGDSDGANHLYRVLSADPDREIRSEARFRLAKLAIARRE